MSGSRPSFRAAAAQRLAEDSGALPAAVEEFLSWQASIDQHGLAGLRTTRIQQYRA